MGKLKMQAADTLSRPTDIVLHAMPQLFLTAKLARMAVKV
jgi:hypothetical protein